VGFLQPVLALFDGAAEFAVLELILSL